MTRSTRFPIRWSALLVLALIPILCQAPATAATLTWPGSAPCDTTLQACVDAAAINDVVQIGSGAGEITTALAITKPITLRSAPLARGRFRNTTVTIQSSLAGTGNVNVLENVQLINTPVSVSLGSTEPLDQHVVELNQLDIFGLASPTAGISVTTPQTASRKTLRIRHLRFAGGVGVAHSGDPPFVSVEIADSQFIETAPGSPVVFVLDGNQQFGFRRNRIESLNIDVGICLTLHARAGASVSAEIDRNLVNGCEAGVSLVAQSGATALQAKVRNNTMRTRLYGVTVSGTAASAGVDNNIFSRVATSGVANFAGAQVLAAHNLYHQTPQTLAGEIGWVVADPLFASTYDFHLTPASPAINAGFAVSIPAGGDFDGVTGTVPTIGAHDYQFGGADLHVATAENSASNITNLPTSMSRPLNEVMVQSVIEGFPLPAWAPNHLGVYSFTTAPARTVIFSQNQQSISPPRQFFVLDSNRHQTLSHTADVSNISAHVSYLNWAPLNGNPFAKPVVVQRAVPVGGVLNDHPVGVWYNSFNARWAVFNQDLVVMPPGAMFDVTLATDFVTYAFTAAAAVSPSLDLILDHPLLNNSPCAAVFVTPVFRDTYLPSAVHVRYRPTTNDGGRWTVVRGDGELFQNGMDMHVYVDPVRSRSCLSDGLFRNGLE